jgi:hypothetical protein
MVEMDIAAFIHNNNDKIYKVLKRDMNGDGLMAVAK